MGEEKRKAGAYEITESFRIGEKEFIVGRNPEDTSGHKYVCGTYEHNAIFERYTFTHGSDDFAEIAQAYGEGIRQEAQRFRSNLLSMNVSEEDRNPVSAKKYQPIQEEDNLENKVIVIRPDILQPEYQAAVYQIMLCTGGFGSHPNSRGRNCHCFNLYDGHPTQFYRSEVAGIMKPEHIPAWAKKTIDQIQSRKNPEKNTEVR